MAVTAGYVHKPRTNFSKLVVSYHHRASPRDPGITSPGAIPRSQLAEPIHSSSVTFGFPVLLTPVRLVSRNDERIRVGVNTHKKRLETICFLRPHSCFPPPPRFIPPFRCNRESCEYVTKTTPPIHPPSLQAALLDPPLPVPRSDLISRSSSFATALHSFSPPAAPQAPTRIPHHTATLSRELAFAARPPIPAAVARREERGPVSVLPP